MASVAPDVAVGAFVAVDRQLVLAGCEAGPKFNVALVPNAFYGEIAR
jgi:hypothetical protein